MEGALKADDDSAHTGNDGNIAVHTSSMPAILRFDFDVSRPDMRFFGTSMLDVRARMVPPPSAKIIMGKGPKTTRRSIPMGSTHTMSRNNGTSESKYHFVVLEPISKTNVT